MDYKPIIPPAPEPLIEKNKSVLHLLKHVDMEQALKDWESFEKRLKHEVET